MLKLNSIKLRVKRPFNFTLSKKRVSSSKSNKRYILFSDSSADTDASDIFDRRYLSNEIVQSIHESEGQMNFLISGEWGIGKTSILKLAENKLKKIGIRTLWFSPWKYSGSDEKSNAISRAFLTDLANQLGKGYLVKDLYLKKQIENERNFATQIITLIQLIIRYVLYLTIIFLVLSVISPFIVDNIRIVKSAIDKIGESETIGIISALLALPPLGQYFVSKIREQGEIEKIGTPELFEARFESLINKTVKFKTLQKALSLWEETFLNTWLWPFAKITNIFYKIPSLKLKKVVVFADDLDRCEGGEISEFLKAMKTFFDHERVYYVIAADLSKFKKDKPDFLRKIVQIDWNVPQLSKVQLQTYIKLILKQAGAPETLIDINQVAYMFSLNPNPRKIKYYLRRFLFLLNYQHIYEAKN